MQMSFLLWLQSLRMEPLNTVMIGVTNLGSEAVYIVLIAFLYWCTQKKEAFKWMNVLMISALSNAIIKIAVHAARPFQVNPDLKGLYVSSATSYSFPSGHSMNAAANLTWAARLIRKPWFTGLAVVLMGAIGFSRLYLGVHWPQDVLVGLAFGVFVAFAYEWYCKKMPDYVELPALFLAIIVSVAFRDESSLKLLGTFVGGILGYWFGNVKDLVKVHPWKEGGWIKFVLGLVVLVALLLGLKAVLPKEMVLYRYAIVGFTLTFLWPWLFQQVYERRTGETT